MTGLIIGVCFLLLIGFIAYLDSKIEKAEINKNYKRERQITAEDMEALLILDKIKYKEPELWTKVVSDIMGKKVTPPTKEECKEHEKL